MTPIAYAWLIAFLPFVAFAVNIVVGHRLGRDGAARVSIALLAVATVLAATLLVEVHRDGPMWDRAVATEIPAVERSVAGTLAQLEEARRVGAAAEVVERRQAELESLHVELAELKEQALTREAAPDFPFVAEIPWISIAGEAGVPLGLLLDPFAAVMALMVTAVSLLIHLFSVSYMRGQARNHTFFAYLSLFTAAMLGMVLSKNLFHVLLFWELMGVMSYLLIGFFYRRRAAQQAMKKAFLTTKVADLAFLIGVFWIYREFQTLDIPTIAELAPNLLAGMTGAATGMGLLLLLGAMGKSAQFPLHVWLLDAMEGPTPVSAMIHAATMVAAGVFLLARTYPILELGGVLPVAAAIGVFTALFAAVLALAFADIKKILAWSTVSQLGLMFLALGAFGWIAAVFHLLTHAFFKALLFLGAGSMIHAAGTQDIFRMNRLGKYMPVTRWTFVIGGLSLAGIVPFAGFWSKDEILLAVKTAAQAAPAYWILIVAAYATSLLTALYIARAYLIAFERDAGQSPWDAATWNQGAFGELGMSEREVAEDRGLEHAEPTLEPHESPWPIRSALVALAGGSIIVGLIGSPLLGQELQLFVYHGAAPHVAPLADMWLGFLLGTLFALAGLAAAWLLYGTKGVKLAAPRGLSQLLQKRFYLDHAYYAMFARPLSSLGQPLAWADRRLLDGAIDLGAWLLAVLADALRRLQTGRLEHYAWTLALGAVILTVALSLAGGAP